MGCRLDFMILKFFSNLNDSMILCFGFAWAQVVKLCRECLKKQEPVLGDTNIYLLRILSIASEVLSYLQMFEEAADYAKRMVDGYLYAYALFLAGLCVYAVLGSVLQEFLVCSHQGSGAGIQVGT